MALLFFDGFDQYTTSGATTGHQIHNLNPVNYVSTANTTVGGNTPGVTTMPELGSLGIRCRLGIPLTSSHIIWGYNLPRVFGSGDTLGFGAHIYVSEWELNTLKNYFFGLGNVTSSIFSTSNACSFQYHTTSGQGRYVSPGGVVDDFFPTQLSVVGVVHHVEVKYYLHETEGSVELRVNGQTEYSRTGINTLPDNLSIIRLAHGVGAGGGLTSALYLDNLYVWDQTGDTNNDWLGERSVTTLLPNEDGSLQEWALSSGSDGYSLINGVPPGSEDISATEVGKKSSFGFTDLPSVDVGIIGVKTEVSAQKDGTAPASVTIGPVGYPGAAHPLTLDQYLRFNDVWDVNPATGMEWQPGELNSFILELERTI